MSWFPLKSQRVSENVTPVTTARGPGDLERVIAIRTRTKAVAAAAIDGKKGIGIVPNARRRPTPEIEKSIQPAWLCLPSIAISRIPAAAAILGSTPDDFTPLTDILCTNGFIFCVYFTAPLAPFTLK